jgi:hypothetical protein
MLRAVGRSEPAAPVATLRRPWAGVLVVVACVAVVIASVFFFLSARSAPARVELRPDVTFAIANAASPPESPAPRDVAPSSLAAPSAPVVLARPVACTERVLSEHDVLDRAQRALDAGYPALALAAVEEHARLFHGGGLLAEKREGLRVRALEAAGSASARHAAPSVGTAPGR